MDASKISLSDAYVFCWNRMGKYANALTKWVMGNLPTLPVPEKYTMRFRDPYH